MANKLIRIGYTQIIPANPGRPPTPAYTVTTVVPATSPIPASGGGGNASTGGSWVLMPSAGNGGISYGGGYVWVPSGGIVLNTGVQSS